MIKGSFPLRAWNGVFFVSFIDFFASLSAPLNFKGGNIKKKTKNALFHVRSGNKPLVETFAFLKTTITMKRNLPLKYK